MCFNPGPERRVLSPNRYIAVASFCFCKDNKRTIIITVLQPPDSFGVKFFEVAVLLAVFNACRPVKDAGDLLILRETLLEELGPAYMWLNLSVVQRTGSLYLRKTKS
jgi:hypothetical protein